MPSRPMEGERCPGRSSPASEAAGEGDRLLNEGPPPTDTVSEAVVVTVRGAEMTDTDRALLALPPPPVA